MSRRHLIVVGVFAMVLATVVIIVASRPFQIAYHRYALDRIHEQIFGEPTSAGPNGLVSYGNENLFDRQQWHCGRLVMLGYFFHKTYKMEHLPDTGDVHSAFWRLLQRDFPDRRCPSLTYPDNVLEVWDRVEYEPKWDAFAEKHNTIDFADRFMKPATDDAEP